MKRWTAKVYFRDAKTGAEVKATLRRHVMEIDFLEHERRWRPYLLRSLLRWHLRGRLSERWQELIGWDWRRIADPRNYPTRIRCYAITVGRRTEGLMMLQVLRAKKRQARIYVAYLEVAPWNRMLLTKEPRYRGIGTVLLQEAIQYSLGTGNGGRIGLHSLPRSI